MRPARSSLVKILVSAIDSLFPTGDNREGVEYVVKEGPGHFSAIPGLNSFLHTEEGNADPFSCCFPSFDGEGDVVGRDGVVEAGSDDVEVEVCCE